MSAPLVKNQDPLQENLNTEKMTGYSYVLITPARNEEEYIEKTILSVVSQTVLPKKWIIVSDGSTDKTDEIVEKYLPQNPWMELLRRYGKQID